MDWKRKLNKYGLPDKVLFLLLGLSLLSTFAELAGIGMFYPVFEVLKDSDFINDAPKDGIITYLFILFKFLNIKLSLESLLIVTFLLFSVSKLFLYLVTYTNSFYLGLLIKRNRDGLLKAYLNCDSSYYDKISIGNFINQSTVELPVAINGIMIPIKFIVSSITALGSITLLILISYKLTILSIFIVLISLIYPYRWVEATTGVGKKNSQYNSVVVSFLLDRLKSPRLVRLTGTSGPENTMYGLITEKQRKLTLAIHLLKARVELILEPAIIGASLIILYIALSMLKLEFSVVMLYLIIVIRLLPIIRNLVNQKQSMNRSKGPIESMDLVLRDMEDSVKEFQKYSTNLSKNIAELHKIQLKGISFTYKNKIKPALNDVNLIFNKSTLSAIVGPSGGGKSTLIDLISGYRKKTDGSLYVNGKDNNTLLLDVSFVPQEPQIFDGTIRSHILYGLVNYSDSVLVKAAKLSGAYEFIDDLPNKFDTKLRENASNLSGGQKQRLDLARALARNSQLLILDEPTGSLDMLAERSFMETINNIRNETDKIIIIIAHRLNTVIDADQIIVLENGKVTGVGRHSDLLSNNEWYSNALTTNKV